MKYAVIITFFLVSISLFAKTQVGVGQSQLNAGLGMSSWGIPIYVGLDYGVENNITVGGEISFRSYDDDWKNRSYKHSIIGISGNFNYHFNEIMKLNPKWDIYAGINVGFYIWTSDNDYHGDRTSGLGLGAQVGARYYFSNKFGLNLEFGGGNAFSGGKIGISLKL
ncbi:MAG TPA: outer membrane beta-barrel protein [Candidatus Kapabacteria bacterium]|nr:outer membrane beta-barrel protein [Candidatus Kapabacteria bacterium]